MKKFNLLIPFIILCSCIKEADEVKIARNLERQIIVKCLISPQDSVLSVSLRQTIPFFNKDDYHLDEQYIKDAIVTLSDGYKSVKLTYNETFNSVNNVEAGVYTCPATMLPINAGKEYYLSVDAPDGRHIDARTRIPEELPSISIAKFDSSYKPNTGWYYAYEFDFSAKHKYDCRFSVNYKKLENVWFDYFADSLSYNISTIKKINAYSDKGIGYWREYHNEYYNYLEKFSSVNIFYFAKSLNKYYPNKIIDPLMSADSTYDITQEPLYMEPFYFHSNVNGGLGFFEGYQKITQEYKSH